MRGRNNIFFLFPVILGLVSLCKACSSTSNKNTERITFNGTVFESTDANEWAVGEFDENQNTDCDAPTLPNVGYAFRGYNILIGNPFHADTDGDPGFKLPIFKASQYGRRNADMTFRLPDGVYGYKKQICKLDSDSKEISNAKGYQDDLLVKADVNFDAGELVPLSFSANSEYKKKIRKMSRNNHLFVKTENTCNVFEIKLNQNVPPKFTDGFLAAVKRLQNVKNERAYLDFVNDFGTHYITKTHMGARYAVETEFDNTTRDELFHEDFDFKLGAKLNFMVNFGLNMNVEKNQEIIDTYQELQKSHSILSYGSPIPKDGDAKAWANSVFKNPLPISYQLSRIQDLFSSRFMGNLQQGLEYDKIHQALASFIKRYCSQEKENLGISGCHGPNAGCGGGNDCHHNAVCKDIIGKGGISTGFKCDCQKGYQGDGRKCTGWQNFQSELQHNRYDGEKQSDIWGVWKKKELCPPDTFAYRFALRAEAHYGAAGDDSALNGVKFYCKSKTGDQRGDITSGIGREGSWTKAVGCTKEDEFLVGYRFKAEVSSNNADNWFGENFDAYCEKGEQLKGADLPLDNGNWPTGGQWSSETRCPTGAAICGMQTKIESFRGWTGDDAGLTDVKIYCCKF